MCAYGGFLCGCSALHHLGGISCIVCSSNWAESCPFPWISQERDQLRIELGKLGSTFRVKQDVVDEQIAEVRPQGRDFMR